MLTLNVYAATTASDQIAAYDGDAIACGNGRLVTELSIDGTDQMKKLGDSKIRISEDDGKSGWIIAEVFASSDDGMIASGKIPTGPQNTLMEFRAPIIKLKLPSSQRIMTELLIPEQ